MNSSIPSLGLLSSTFGDETPVEWLKIQLGSLNDFAEVSEKISGEQLHELATLILAEYYYLNAAELCLFIARFKAGHYGRFYGAIDPMKITCALLDYKAERRKGILLLEAREAELKASAEREERARLCVTKEEYLELLSRANSGDKQALASLLGPSGMP